MRKKVFLPTCLYVLTHVGPQKFSSFLSIVSFWQDPELLLQYRPQPSQQFIANWRILRHVTKQALLQSLCRRPWWLTSCSIWKQTQRKMRRNPSLNLNVVNGISTQQTALVSLTRLEILHTLQTDLSDCLSTSLSGNFSGTFSCFFSVHLSGVLSGCFLLCLKTDRQKRPQKCR